MRSRPPLKPRVVAIAPHLKDGVIVTEVGSVKAAVIRQVLDRLPAQASFVPGHPIAGTEHSGPDAGFAELFEGRWCILTPCERSSEAAVAQVTALWCGLGSQVEIMTPEHHDIVLAITSHIPHLIAFNIVGTAADVEEVTRSEVIKFSAGGFRDFTRIAASDPVMWRDVFLNNKEAVLEMLERFSEDLAALQRMIRWDDGDALLDLFTRTRDIRRGIIEAGQETDEPDFGRRHGHED
jgi:cyclohexadieny/prephenate dehydrogenase